MPVYQIIYRYGLKALFGQLFAAMGSDIPGTAGNQYVHRMRLRITENFEPHAKSQSRSTDSIEFVIL
jgi:hypothetical protein